MFEFACHYARVTKLFNCYFDSVSIIILVYISAYSSQSFICILSAVVSQCQCQCFLSQEVLVFGD